MQPSALQAKLTNHEKRENLVVVGLSLHDLQVQTNRYHLTNYG